MATWGDQYNSYANYKKAQVLAELGNAHLTGQREDYAMAARPLVAPARFQPSQTLPKVTYAQYRDWRYVQALAELPSEALGEAGLQNRDPQFGLRNYVQAGIRARLLIGTEPQVSVWMKLRYAVVSFLTTIEKRRGEKTPQALSLYYYMMLTEAKGHTESASTYCHVLQYVGHWDAFLRLAQPILASSHPQLTVDHLRDLFLQTNFSATKYCVKRRDYQRFQRANDSERQTVYSAI